MRIPHTVFVLLLFCAVAASAETVRFRSGEILCAELSKEKPEGIRNADKLDLSELPEGRNALPGSVCFVPAAAGMVIAGEVIKDIIKASP